MTNWLARTFASAVVRKIAYVLVAFALAYFGMGHARAADEPYCPYSGGKCSTESLAAQTCNQWASDYSQNPNQDAKCTIRQTSIRHQVFMRTKSGSNWGTWHNGPTWSWVTGCPANSPPDPSTNYECSNCSEHASLPSASYSSTSSNFQLCKDGCAFVDDGSGYAGSNDGVNWTVFSNSWKPSGNTCSAGTPEPKDKPCFPAPDGQTFCIRPGPKPFCASASTGREICWGPGETGTKTDGPTIQNRAPGTNPPADPVPDNGDGVTKTSGPNNTNLKGGGTGPTIITNITNWTTTSGADGGANNDGQPEGGSPDGDDEGDEKGTAGGGAGCDAPPVCSGGDPQLCAVLEQTWRNRCSANGNKLADGGCNDGAPVAFTCSGDEILCKQALLQKEAQCRAEKNDANGDGQPDWTEGDGPAPGEDDGEDGTGHTKFGIGVSTDLLDQEDIFGGGSCVPFPDITIMGVTTRGMDIPQWCDIVAVMRAVILLIAAFTAINILLGRNS